MAEDKDSSQKTEEPTQRRIEEAVKKGQVPFSREVTNFVMLLTLALIIAGLAPWMFKHTASTLAVFIQNPHDIMVDAGSVGRGLAMVMQDIAVIMLAVLGGTFIAAMLSSFMQNGWVASAEPITPKLEKISPWSGLKRLFSLKSFVEFLKGIFKIIVIGIIAYVVLVPEMDRLEQVPTYSLLGLLNLFSELAVKLLTAVLIVMFIIAVVDYVYQKQEYLKSLRMTKQEVKEEFKQAEGDPMIKARLRQLRMEKAQQRMMAAVPDADVVITNPTHYAVALKYDMQTMGAPHVTAMGQDHLALTMREIAKEHNVPVVENPPLARALYDSAEVDSEIPVEHFQAVAEVISYVYKLKGKKPQGQRAAA